VIAFERLAALALDELEGDELDQVEHHVLSCSSCAATLERLVKLGSATRELLLAGRVHGFVSPALSARLGELGLISRVYRLVPEQVVSCGVGSDDLYVLTELEADLTGVSRLDFLLRTAAGEERRWRDIPFHAPGGLVLHLVRADDLRQLPSTRVSLELRAVDDGHERVLGRYELDHDAGRQ
jgi:hypothetical protein